MSEKPAEHWDASPDPPPASVSEADIIRALSHPTRIALLEALHVNASLTATEASKLIGETPTNCAFHLRALGRYGLVEEVSGGGAGRSRPWRARDVPLTFSDVAENGSDGAASELAQMLMQRWLFRTLAMQESRHLQEPAWQEVLGGSQGVVVGTVEEVRELITDLRALLNRYSDRLTDQARRPTDSKAIELLIFAQPFEPSTTRDHQR